MNLHYGVLVGVLSQPDFEKGKHPHLYVKLDTEEEYISTVAYLPTLICKMVQKFILLVLDFQKAYMTFI